MIKIDKKAIYTFARESFARLMNEKENSGIMPYYSKGFEDGFNKCSEIKEQLSRRIPVHVDIPKMHELEKEFEKLQFGSPVTGASMKMARAMERRIFEVMAETKSTKVFIVDFGPEFDGSVGRWHVDVTCDEGEVKRMASIKGLNYIRHDFDHLIAMTDEEFERLVMEGISRGDRN